jgi:hypothetical protein
MRAACPTNFIILEMITIMIFGKGYKLRSSAFCNFLQPPITSFLLRPNILLRSLFSKILNVFYSPRTVAQISHPCKTTGKISFVYVNIYVCR